VRITDFGLAVAEGEEIHEADVSGTPPYMAPEQFAGKGASVRSDIYALGLVFYELFTGKRAFEAKTMAELRAKKEASSPTAPSEIVRDIDPIVERVILRCIEKDPRLRPASAAQVAAALPGGDPLAAAIAAGETPSPEMVAASGGTGGVRPWIAWACLVFIILGIGTSIWIRRGNLYRRVPIDTPPDAMAEKARDILKSVGYPNRPVDSTYTYAANTTYFKSLEVHDKSPHRYDKLPALAVLFWYRQSPESLGHSVTPDDPPLTKQGESVVWLDALGNLIGLQVIPPVGGKPPGTVQPPDWSVLFKAAGLDQAQYAEVEPDWTYSAYADARKAWKGSLPDRPDLPVRIEAAGWQGKPVFWRLIAPSWESTAVPKAPPSAAEAVTGVATLLMVIFIFIGGAIFARRNLRMGRGDRRGATRLACFLFILNGIVFVCDNHTSFLFILNGIVFVCDNHTSSISNWLVGTGIVWLMYIALEPYVRRRWPDMLIGWNRLLAGDYRDPLVGRDLLFGCAAAIVMLLLVRLVNPLYSLIGAVPQSRPVIGPPYGGVETLRLLSGARAIVVGILGLLSTQIENCFITCYVLFLVRVLLRKTWLTLIFCALLFTMTMTGATGNFHPSSFIILALATCIHLVVIFRFGLLALMATVYLHNILYLFPITTTSAWYSGIGFTGLLLLLALPIFAFCTSLGGQPLFGRAALED
jgi:hypothetical protein